MHPSPQSLQQRFLSEGYVGPLPLLDAGRVRDLHPRIFQKLGVDAVAPGASSAYLSAWHQQERWVWDLVTDPAILDTVEAILGPDLILWATHCWYKEPRSGRRIPWHQDASYWPIEPKRTVTAWIAFGDCNRDNGCLRIIPGSHRLGDIAHLPVQDPRSWFDRGADLAAVDGSRAVDLEMRPGMVTFFNEATLHGSEPNDSPMPRLAMSCRFTTPEVRFHIERWDDPARIRTYLVRGQDRLHLNDAIRAQPPA